MFEKFQYIVVGAGITGAVLAERIAAGLGREVLVVEKRPHIGGNSWSETDPETGIECHRYGSHIFHTSNAAVWEYLRRFTEFNRYVHRVETLFQGKSYPMPVNLKTINDFYGLSLTSAEAGELLKKEAAAAGISHPANMEEKAVSLVGERLYRAFFAGYSKKQWGIPPKELPEEIITRLPVRLDERDNYFDDPWQGIPLCGYGELFRRILGHPRITLELNLDFLRIRDRIPPETVVIHTGMPDEFFGFCYGELEWKSLRFEWETLPVRFHQNIAVQNYADLEIPHTRVHEFKHYHPERDTVWQAARTVICREYSKKYESGEIPSYPVNTRANNERYESYRKRASGTGRLFFAGRLGCYRYWNMDIAVANALRLYEQLKKEDCRHG